MTWTPEQWQAHVTNQEKRINELERQVNRLMLDKSERDEARAVIAKERNTDPSGICLVS